MKRLNEEQPEHAGPHEGQYAQNRCMVIRADASTQMGIGHMMRCLALAQAWQAAGGRAVFLSHFESETAQRRVREAGFDIVSLEKPCPDPSDSQRTDALVREVDATWVVLDGYHFDPKYQREFRKLGHCLLVIDDTAHWPEYHANILLNQNINAAQLLYQCDSDTRLLLGTQYALLRREFSTWRGWEREIPKVGRKVLVTLGGGDPDNVTLKVVRALQQVKMDNWEACVVMGGSNPHMADLKSEVANTQIRIRLEHDITNMPELMAWADVAISGGGSTCWELAFMGLPSLVIVVAENQRDIAQGLAAAGSVVNLGWFDRIPLREIAQGVIELLGTRELRMRMSETGHSLVDGEGATRVIAAMVGD